MEVHQDLHHLLDKHFLEVFVSAHEPNKDLLVPGLGPLHVKCILEDTSSGLSWLVSPVILEGGSSGGEEAPGDQNLKENFTVATIVELVTSRVQEFEHSIEVNSDLEEKRGIN